MSDYVKTFVAAALMTGFAASLMFVLGNGCATPAKAQTTAAPDAGLLVGVDVYATDSFEAESNAICIYIANVKRMRCMSVEEFEVRFMMPAMSTDKPAPKPKGDL